MIQGDLDFQCLKQLVHCPLIYAFNDIAIFILLEERGNFRLILQHLFACLMKHLYFQITGKTQGAVSPNKSGKNIVENYLPI